MLLSLSHLHFNLGKKSEHFFRHCALLSNNKCDHSSSVERKREKIDSTQPVVFFGLESVSNRTHIYRDDLMAQLWGPHVSRSLQSVSVDTLSTTERVTGRRESPL